MEKKASDVSSSHSSSKRQSSSSIERLPMALRPPVQRRKALPYEQIYGEAISFVSILTRNLPICVFEPLGDVQAAAEEVRYARQYLDKMCSTADPAERLSLLCAFIVSGYSGMVGRRRKPFNPLLGETYDYISEDGWKYHSEQISHHPPITACHAESDEWELFQALQGKVTFTLNSVSITSILPVRLTLRNGDEYCWNKVTTTIQNARAESHNRRVINEGDMIIRTNIGVDARMKFHNNEDNTVTGEIFRSQDASVVCSLTGSWDKGLNKVLLNNQLVRIFEPIPLNPKSASSYYGFSDFAIALNELHSYENPYLPPTDSRYRPDQRHLENAEPKLAEKAKKKIEHAQRKRASQPHKIMWFSKVFDNFTGQELWRSNKLYWSSKEAGFKNEHSKQILQLFEKPQ